MLPRPISWLLHRYDHVMESVTMINRVVSLEGVDHMSVLDIETLGFGVSKETFDPPSFPVKTQSTFGCRDICSHYNQFVFDLSSIRESHS